MNDEDAAVINVVRAALPSIARAVDLVVAALSAGGRLIYVGAGTSGRLGVLDAVECVPTFGVPPGLIIGIMAGGTNALTNAIEGAEDHLEDGQRDLEAIRLTSSDIVVGIAASGHTPYVLGAIQYASRVGAETVGIACNQPSPLLEVVNIAIGLPVGRGSDCGFNPPQGRDCAKNGVEYAQHGGDGQIGQGLWQPDGRCIDYK